MKIIIPFVYTAQVVMPRCRKESRVILRGEHEIEIQEIPEIPVAAFWESDSPDPNDSERVINELGYANGCFWSLLNNQKRGEKPVRVELSEFIETVPRALNTRAFGHSVLYLKLSERDALSKIEQLPDFESITPQVREYCGDNRQEYEDALNNYAARFCVSQGLVYEKVPEPVYFVQTFGMGKNNGGTALFMGSAGEARNCASAGSIFNLAQLRQAEARANEVARSRGDTKSVPVKLNSCSAGKEPTITMPEAFTFDATGWDEYQAGHISLATYLSHNPANTDRLKALVEQTAQRIAAEIMEEDIENQVAWLTDQIKDVETIVDALEIRNRALLSEQ